MRKKITLVLLFLVFFCVFFLSRQVLFEKMGTTEISVSSLYDGDMETISDYIEEYQAVQLDEYGTRSALNMEHILVLFPNIVQSDFANVEAIEGGYICSGECIFTPKKNSVLNRYSDEVTQDGLKTLLHNYSERNNLSRFPLLEELTTPIE